VTMLAAPPLRAADALAAKERASMQAIAIRLFESLTPEQKPRAVLPVDSPERDAEMFTGGPRPGIPLRDLNDDQRALARTLLTQFTSDYGAGKADAIIAQDPGGFGRYYLAFFGEPGPGRTYAWRIAEHHLTLVHVEGRARDADDVRPDPARRRPADAVGRRGGSAHRAVRRDDGGRARAGVAPRARRQRGDDVGWRGARE